MDCYRVKEDNSQNRLSPVLMRHRARTLDSVVKELTPWFIVSIPTPRYSTRINRQIFKFMFWNIISKLIIEFLMDNVWIRGYFQNSVFGEWTEWEIEQWNCCLYISCCIVLVAGQLNDWISVANQFYCSSSPFISPIVFNIFAVSPLK